MPKAKIAVSLDEAALAEIDRLVRSGVFNNRSQAIEASVKSALARLARTRLAAECAKLDRKDEKDRAEEGLSEDIAEWPEY